MVVAAALVLLFNAVLSPYWLLAGGEIPGVERGGVGVGCISGGTIHYT